MWCSPSPAVSTCDKLLSSHLSSVECLVFTHPHDLMRGYPFCHHWVRRRQLINMGIPAYAKPSSRELPPSASIQTIRGLGSTHSLGSGCRGSKHWPAPHHALQGMSGTRLLCCVFMLRAWHLKNARRKGQYFVEEDQRGIAKVLTFLAPQHPLLLSLSHMFSHYHKKSIYLTFPNLFMNKGRQCSVPGCALQMSLALHLP